MKVYNDIMNAITEMSNSESKSVRAFSNVLSVVGAVVILGALSGGVFIVNIIASILK